MDINAARASKNKTMSVRDTAIGMRFGGGVGEKITIDTRGKYNYYM